jgi:hypothetical protein
VGSVSLQENKWPAPLKTEPAKMRVFMHGYFRNYGCRILEFELLGYRSIALENESLRVTLLADKGACLYELLHKPSDTDFLWRWERGLRPKGYVESISHPRGNFQEHFSGGWDEMFPVFGGGAVMGALPIGYHGEVACVPWDYVIQHDDAEQIAVQFSSRTVRTPFLITRTLGLLRECPTLSICETVTNEGATELSFVWGHHPCFGPPFLSPYCRIDSGARSTTAYRQDAYDRGRLAIEDQSAAWPHLKGRDGKPIDLSRVLGLEARVSDGFYLTDFDEPAWSAVTNLKSGVGIALAWTREVMPCAWMWQGFGGDEVAPWWGRAYVLAIEPLSSCPMSYPDAVRLGTTRKLGPGESLSFKITATAYAQAKGVRAVSVNGGVDPIT